MLQTIFGFILGAVSSALIAWIVYRRQKKESLDTEGKLLLHMARQLRVAGVAAATSIINLDATKKLERDIAVLRRQVGSMAIMPKSEHDLLSAENAVNRFWGGGPLSIDVLCQIHGSLIDQPSIGGVLRDIAVEVGHRSIIGVEAFRPTPSEHIRSRLTDLFEWWQQILDGSGTLSPAEMFDALTRLYYGLLEIHPFLDGNGVVARTVLLIQGRRLLGYPIFVPRNSASELSALRTANEGDLGPLRNFLYACSRTNDGMIFREEGDFN